MVEITDRSNFGRVHYKDANYEMNGDFHQNPETKAITALNLNANRIDGTSVGNVSSLLEGEQLKFNLNNIPSEEMVSITTSVTNCINELKEVPVEQLN